MNQPERILAIEIKTMDNPGFDSTQIQSITVYENSGSYYLALDNSQIHPHIIEAVKTIINLGNNYRHPLYFDVQIVNGNGMDAGVDITQNRVPKSSRRKRKRRTN